MIRTTQTIIVNTNVQYDAHLIAPAAIHWLENRKRVEVFQVFDKSCNLIDSSGSIMSLVSMELGPGPFALTVTKGDSSINDPARLWEGVQVSSKVSLSEEKIKISSLAIDLSQVELWNPKPAWEKINSRESADIYRLLDKSINLDFRQTDSFFSMSGEGILNFGSRMEESWSDIFTGLVDLNLETAKAGARKIAGLGSGLTPAGDDFLMGLIFALWSAWGGSRAQPWAEELAKAAIPLTTRLSAAWLRSAANGEAAEPWHDLINAIAEQQPDKLLEASTRILATGHSSGTFALSGYIAGLSALTGGYRHDFNNGRGR